MKNKVVIRARDGTKLAVTRYLPRRSNHTAIVIAPALGRRQKQYSSLAKFLCREGHVVYTFDYRGVGRSRKTGGDHEEASLYQWASIDLDTVILYAKNQFPCHELAGVAHGVSGQVVGLALASTFFSRLVLVDAALTSWNLAGRSGRARLLLSCCLLAGCRWIPGVSHFLGKGIPPGVFREWLCWAKYPNGLFHFYSNNNYQKIRAPILSANFSQTPFITPKAVKALLAQFANAPCSDWYFPVSPLPVRGARNRRLRDKGSHKALWRALSLWMQGEEAFPDSGKGTWAFLPESMKSHTG